MSRNSAKAPLPIASTNISAARMSASSCCAASGCASSTHWQPAGRSRRGAGPPASMPRSASLLMRKIQVAVVAALLLDSVGMSKAAPAPTLQGIIDGARQEGQLSIVAGEAILGGENARLIEAFNK